MDIDQEMMTAIRLTANVYLVSDVTLEDGDTLFHNHS